MAFVDSRLRPYAQPTTCTWSWAKFSWNGCCYATQMMPRCVPLPLSCRHPKCRSQKVPKTRFRALPVIRRSSRPTVT